MEKSLVRSNLVPLIVSCALFMENLDGSIIATALPTIAQSLQTDPLHLSLAITTYLLGLALFIPLSGWAADRFGARTVFRWAIAVFTVSSVFCGLAQSLPQLVAARLVQGIGGALMVPVGRMVLFKTIPKKDLVGALAWLTIPALVGPILGPPVGGFIVTYWSWRWIFLVNVPIGILGFILVSVFIEDLREEKVVPFDLRGFVFLSLSLACLVFGFETTGRHMIDGSATGAMIVAGIALMLLFFVHARRVKYPIVDLTIFKNQTFGLSVIGGALFRIGIGATPFLLPMMLQIGFGYSPLKSGLLVFVTPLGAMVMKPLAQILIRRFGFRSLLVANGAISVVLMAARGLFDVSTPVLLILATLFCGGLSHSLQFTALNALGFGDMPNRKVSRATTIFSMIQQLAFSFGVALGAFLLSLTMMMHDEVSLRAQDFTFAMLGVALLSALSIPFFVRLAPEAGAEVSGHRRKTLPPVIDGG